MLSFDTEQRLVRDCSLIQLVSRWSMQRDITLLLAACRVEHERGLVTGAGRASAQHQ